MEKFVKLTFSCLAKALEQIILFKW